MLGLVLLLASLGVMLAAGPHSARLDIDSFVLDCDDEFCGPLWDGPRQHYRTLALAAAGGAVVGWLLAAWARPVRSALPEDGHRPPAGFGAVVVADVLTLSVAVPASLVAPPLGAAVLGIGITGVALLGWRTLRAVGVRDRAAWIQAGGLGLLGLAGAVLAASAALRSAADAGPLGDLLLVAPLTLPLLHVLLFRAAAHARRDGPGRATASGGAPTPDPRAPIRWSIAAPGALAILLVAGAAAVPAPEPADPVALPTPEATLLEPTLRGPTPPAGSAQAPAPSLPPAPPTPSPSAVPADVPDCGEGDVELRLGGFDSAMGDSAAGLTARNTGGRACTLRGRPALTIVQGGDPIDLRPVPAGAMLQALTAEEAAAEPSGLGVILEPGGEATADLFWPGYRHAADQTTPQSVSVTLGDGGPAAPAPVADPGTPGWHPGPAPFDLQDDVPGGAELRVGLWTPAA